MSEGPLAGLRIVEVNAGVAAAFAGKLLADYGAEVTKIEPPGGDPARHHGPFPGGRPDLEQSALFLYLNTNKHSVTLDLATAAGRADAQALGGAGDLVIDDQPLGQMADWGLDHAALSAAHPHLVTMSLTPFGESGPYAGYRNGNLVAFAMGGQMSVTGEPGREPLKNAGYQADYQLGLNGFSAAAIALYGVRHGLPGQHIELSSLECQASVLEASLNTYAYTGRALGTRRGLVRSSTIALYECADGWLGVHAMPRNLPFLLELMGMPDLMKDERFATPAARLEHNDELMAIYMGWALEQHKKDVYRRAGPMRAPVAYVHTIQDLRESPQLNFRNFWRETTHPVAGTLTYPGPPFQMSDSPWRLAPAPPLRAERGLRNAELPTEPVQAAQTPSTVPDSTEQAANDQAVHNASVDSALRIPRSALESVRVLDLTMVWAGPYGTRILADMGAEVLKIEAVNFYDQLRNLGFAPPGTEKAWNKAAYFNHNNRNKYSVVLDLRNPEGRDLLLELVKTADIVVENYRAEVMDQLGLGYEQLKAVKPDIILISMPGHGKTGPEKDFVAYGTNIEQLSGLVSLSGYEHESPHPTGISYGDPMSGTAMAGAAAAALLHRDRTGHGQYIELAQRELMVSLIGEYVVAQSMTGEQPAPIGNRHPFHAPHGVYPVQIGPLPPKPHSDGLLPDPPLLPAPDTVVEPWLAIACTTDEEFAALCREMGQPELAADPRFAGQPARHAHQDELDPLISAWTAGFEKMALFHRLQAAGVPCGPVLTAAEVFHNEHLRARGFFEHVTHPDAGTWDMEGPLYHFTATPAHIRLNAPCFGEHNEYALGHLLGLPEQARASLEAGGVTGDTPNMSVHQ